jgi:hypothetical protein
LGVTLGGPPQPPPPPPPRTWALLVNKDRRHLFVTPGLHQEVNHAILGAG